MWTKCVHCENSKLMFCVNSSDPSIWTLSLFLNWHRIYAFLKVMQINIVCNDLSDCVMCRSLNIEFMSNIVVCIVCAILFVSHESMVCSVLVHGVNMSNGSE